MAMTMTKAMSKKAPAGSASTLQSMMKQIAMQMRNSQQNSSTQLPRIDGLTINPTAVNFENGQTLEISFNLNQMAVVTAAIYNSAGNKVKTLLNGIHLNAGVNKITWTGTDDSGNKVAAGNYVIQITPADMISGKTGETVSAQFSVGSVNNTADTTAPQITGLTVTPSTIPLTGANVTISFEISENAKVTVQVLNSSNQVIATPLNNADKSAGTVTATWDGKDYSMYPTMIMNLQAGTYTIKVTAVDASGNSNTATFQITAA
ncbi:peptidase S8 and S53 subtilisin kexin sedolisin [Carboxydothermus islandicus]|uniref:Peptidase S8 and S53 subtilisin kexin sedolisin n=2 Tax=Carboxydothermus islandicus TaxID=661089 RepID=A0A1L8D1W5_9THEO|nr:peptidase S8 and S53 subtilisin kexin sedolisin [Carboxydothermus islandicus]